MKTKISSPYSAKLRQFKHLAERVNKALDSGEFYEIQPKTQSSLIAKLKYLFKQLSFILSFNHLKSILAGAFFLILISKGSDLKAQSFAPPIEDPFGITDQLADDTSIRAIALVDIDNDGDLDLMVGDQTSFHFFENTGDANNPTFVAPVMNPFGLGLQTNTPNLTFVDIDNDEDQDVFFGFWGGLTFIENIGSASTPSFDQPTESQVSNSLPSYAAFPTFADVDDDGDFDLFVGEAHGADHYDINIQFFKNIGTKAESVFGSRVENPFGIITSLDSATPAFNDIDQDGDLDLFIGQREGLNLFLNSGTSSEPEFLELLEKPYGLEFSFGYRSFLAFGDIDNDGDLDLFASDSNGNIQFFEFIQTNTPPTVDTPIPDQEVKSLSLFEFVFDNDAFEDLEVGSQVTFSASLADDSSLPLWLSFNGTTRTFLGTPLETDNSITIKVTATDNGGLTASDEFEINVLPANLLPKLGGTSITLNYTEGDGALRIGEGLTVTDEDDTKIEGARVSISLNYTSGKDFLDVLNLDSLDEMGTVIPSPIEATFNIESGELVMQGSASLVEYERALGKVHYFNRSVSMDLSTREIRIVVNDGIDNSAEITRDVGILGFEGLVGRSFAEPVENAYNISLFVNGQFRPELIDIDNDGDQDLFIGNSPPSVRFLENIGSNTSPSFASPQTFPYPFGITGASYFTAPAFVDIDADGDFDLVSDTYYGLYFFQNTGNSLNPAFAAPELNPFSLPVSYYIIAPTFVDIDNDGDFDLFTGESYEIRFFENIGSATSPEFGNPQVNPFGITIEVEYLIPEFSDIDADGDFDLILGEYYGNLLFFENIGSNTAPSFAAPKTNPFGLERVYYYSGPSFSDIDHDGDFDLFVGSDEGNIYFFEFINTSSPPILVIPIPDQEAEPLEAFSFTFDASTFKEVDVGDQVSLSAMQSDDSNLPTWLGFDAPSRTFSGTPGEEDESANIKVTATDLEGLSVSDDFTLVVGNVTAVNNTEVFNEVRIFPNPASDFITLSIDNVKAGNLELYFTNGMGKILSHEKILVHNSPFDHNINTSGLKPGLYLIQIVSVNEVWIGKLIVE